MKNNIKHGLLFLGAIYYMCYPVFIFVEYTDIR